MDYYSGFNDRGHNFGVYIPTDVKEPLSGVIKISNGREVTEHYFSLSSLPRWDILRQCYELKRKDRGTLERLTNKLLRDLP